MNENWQRGTGEQPTATDKDLLRAAAMAEGLPQEAAMAEGLPCEAAMAEDVLRRVLTAEADRIEPSLGALAGIQRRIRTGEPRAARWWWRDPGRSLPRVARPRWGGWSPLAAGAVTVATLSVAAVLVGLAGTVVPSPSDQAGPLPGADRSVDPVASAGSVRPGPTPPGGAVAPSIDDSAGTSEPGSNPGTARLAVYYQGGDPNRPRLYREFHRLWLHDGSAQDRITAAVRNLLDGPAGMDPDYRNAWPVGTDLRGVSVSAGVATVDLAGAASNDVDDVTARLAVQQLVWTVTAVPEVSGLRLRLDGAPVDRLWGRIEVSGVLRRAPAVDVLAPVWLISPQHGDIVGRTFQVHIAGILPEATAQFRIERGGRTVREQHVTLSEAGPAQGERTFTVTLAPGRYTLTAYGISLADGREQHHDQHTITVR